MVTNGTYLVLLLVLNAILYCECGLCLRKCSCLQAIVRCDGKKLTSMPSAIPPDVLQLNVDNNLISELPLQMLQGGNSLLKLNLSYNVIQSLTEDNFHNTPSLTSIDLSHNNVTFLPGNVFKDLKDLQSLILSENEIARLSPESFKDLSSLRYLNLSNNRIRAVSIDLFTSLPNLQSLSLVGNKISIIPDGLFRDLPTLVKLDLSRNRIRRVTINTFDGLTSLQELHLQNNKIQSIDEHLPTPDLTCDTEVAGNRIISEAMKRPEAEDGVLSNLRNLKFLDLQYNLLKTLKISSFHGLKHLKTLILGENKWRCSCALKQTIKSLRYYLHNEEIWLGDIHCDEPDRIKNVNLDGLSIEDLKSIEKSMKESTTQSTKTIRILTTPVWKWSKVNNGRKTKDSVKSGNQEKSDGRPQNDLVTKGRENDSKQGTFGAMPTTRSLISVFQTGAIAPITSYVTGYHDNSKENGVNSFVRNVVAQQITVAISKSHGPTDQGESPDRDRDQNINNTKISKKNSKERQTILLAIVVVLSFLAICAIGGLISLKYFKRRDKNIGCCLKPGGPKNNSSVRSVTSYPLLYDNHHVARRPLPRAPSFGTRSRPIANEEVRWTNGGVYGLGSNRSSFISLHSQAMSNNNSFDTVLTTLQSGFMSNRDGLSTSNSTQNFNGKFQSSQKSESSHSFSENVQNPQAGRQYGGNPKLLANFKNSSKSVQRSQSTINESQSSIHSRRERMEERRLLRQKRRSLIRPESAIISSSILEVNERPRALPPVPKRSSASRNRCQELRSQQKKSGPKSGINWSHNAYCEIDPNFPMGTSEIVDNILYRKHIAQKNVTENEEDTTPPSVTEKPETQENGPDISEFTRRICDRLVQLHSANPSTEEADMEAKYTKPANKKLKENRDEIPASSKDETKDEVVKNSLDLHIDSKLISANSKEKLDKLYNELIRDMNENESSKAVMSKREKPNGYDKLEFCTSGESASEISCQTDQRSEETESSYDAKSENSKQNLSNDFYQDHKNSSDSLFVDMSSVCDSITTEDDAGSSAGEDDFEIIYPIVKSRRTYPLGAFGSDQDILDSLNEQEENAMHGPVHRTAPAGLEHLTVPLSEISTDDDDVNAEVQQRTSKKSRSSSSGSMATVLSKTPEVKNDVFVYTMAGESIPESAPDCSANNKKLPRDSGYETVQIDDGDYIRKENKVSTNKHRYQHIQYMYSGFKNVPVPLVSSKQSNFESKEDFASDITPQCVEAQFVPSLNKIKKNERHYHIIDFDKEQEKPLDTYTQNKNKANEKSSTRHRLYWSIELNDPKNIKLIPFPENPPKTGKVQEANNSASKMQHSSSNSVQKVTRSPDDSIKQQTPKTSCFIELDANRNPVVHMKSVNRDIVAQKLNSPVQKPSNADPMDHIEHKHQISAVFKRNKTAQDDTKRVSKMVGYFEPVESSPDEGTDEEVFDLGTL